MTGKVRARLIYPSISTSERVANLGIKGALLYAFLLPHCDDQGRYAGSARKVKAEAVPLLEEIELEDVEAALEAMVEADLIIRYSEAGRDYIQVVDWWAFNAKLRYTSKSRYPPPENWIDRVTRRDELGKFIGGRKTERLQDFAMDYIAGDQEYDEEDGEEEEEEGGQVEMIC